MNLNETRLAKNAAEKEHREARITAANAIIDELKKTGREVTAKEIANAVGCRPCDLHYLFYPYTHIKTGTRYSLKKFVEVDEFGKVIPDGDVRTIKAIKVTYRYY